MNEDLLDILQILKTNINDEEELLKQFKILYKNGLDILDEKFINFIVNYRENTFVLIEFIINDLKKTKLYKIQKFESLITKKINNMKRLINIKKEQLEDLLKYPGNSINQDFIKNLSKLNILDKNLKIFENKCYNLYIEYLYKNLIKQILDKENFELFKQVIDSFVDDSENYNEAKFFIEELFEEIDKIVEKYNSIVIFPGEIEKAKKFKKKFDKLQELIISFKEYIQTSNMDASYRKMLTTLTISLKHSDSEIPPQIIKILANETTNASRCDMVNAQGGHPRNREITCNKFKTKGYNCIWDADEEICKFDAGPEHKKEKKEKKEKSEECNIM